jgi:outer membrane autotransporter protein
MGGTKPADRTYVLASSPKRFHLSAEKRSASLLGSASGIALAILMSSPAASQTWTGANSTDWTDSGNWVGGVPSNGLVTITTTTPNPTVLGVGGAEAATSNAVNVGVGGGTGDLTIQNGSVLTSTATNLVFIGQNPGSTGSLTVTGSGSQWNVLGAPGINSVHLGGEGGTGTLQVINGATASQTGDIAIGRLGGTGSMLIASGGSVTTGREAFIGRLAGGNGTATVDGVGSQWTVVSNLYVGNGGTGTLNILNNGRMTVTSSTIVGGSGSPGTLNISGGGVLETAALTGGTGPNQFNFDNATIRALAGGVNFMSSYTAAEANIAGGGLTLDTNGFNIGVRGFSGIGGLTITGGGTVEMVTTPSTYTGPTWIQAGSTLNMTFGSIASSSRLIADGTFDIRTGAPNVGIIQSLAGSGSVLQANRNLTITNANDTFSGTIIGSGIVRVTGGVQTFSGPNAYTGNTLVSGTGTLRAGAANAFSAASNYIAQTGGTYDLNGFDQTVASLDNAGTVRLGGAPGTTLTVTGNYIGNGGTVQLNTVLGGDASPTDRLVVTGDTAGSTNVRVINLGGAGAQTVEGIKIVDVGGASNGAFSLQGDYVIAGQQAVIGGAYAYTLQKNGVSTPGDGDWYLRSSLANPPAAPGSPPPPPVLAGPLYQPGVPLYESYGQVVLGLNELSSLQQRVGNRHRGGSDAMAQMGPVKAAASGPVAVGPVWGRFEGRRTNLNPSTTARSTSDTDYLKFEAGIDATALDNSFGKLVLGLTSHYNEADAAITSFFGNGTIRTRGGGIGGTATWYGNDGFYVDGQARASWYSSNLTSALVGAMTSGNDGFGYALGVESGKRLSVGNGWSLTPQAQLTYAAVDFDNFIDRFGALVSLDNADSLLGRAGLSLDHQRSWRDSSGQLLRSDVYGIANLHYEFLEGTRVDVSGTSFANSQDRLWGGMGGGGAFSWANDRYAVYGEASVNTSLDDFGDSYSYKGTAGFRLRW